jgi:malate dehydrogenase
MIVNFLMTITIIGSGKVGASVALNCALRELDDVLLLDIVQGLPQGEALDINNQLSERGIDCKVSGSNNYEDMNGSDFVVIVAGVGRKPGMTRMDLLKTNADIIKNVSSKVKSYAANAISIMVTNPLDPLTYLLLKITGATKNRVMGMGGMLDLSRFKYFIHEATKISNDSIQAMVISEHGENMLPLTRYSTLSGIPLNKFVTEQHVTEIFENTKGVAAQVISLKGATTHAPGNAVATMIESVIKNKRSIIPVSTLLEGEYGAENVCIGVPAIIGSQGVEKIIELPLDNSEQAIFSKGVGSVKEALSTLKL